MKKTYFLSILLIIFLLLFPGIIFASQGGAEGDIVSRINVLVIQLSVIFFAAWAGGSLFEKMKIPSVLGEIIAGVAIGPYALGKIPFLGFENGLFALQSGFPISIELYSLATIASIVLLFVVGLETDMETFVQFSFVGGVIGTFGVLVSFVFGDIVGILFSKYALGTPYGFFHPVCMFFGVISTATSVGISARILSEKKRMNSPDGVTILSAAVIDDVLGIIILAVVIGTVGSHHLGFKQVMQIVLKAVGIWIGFTAAGLIFSPFLSRVLKKAKDKTTIALMSFSLALMLAGIFEKSGLAMIIGAYTMGLSFSKTDIAFLVQEQLEVLQRFFVPIFFCVMGMLINLEVLSSGPILLFGGIYIILAVLGKLIGCSIPALFLNFNLRGALRIGVGMVPRGEVALIVAGIGLSKGIIDNDVFSVAVIMTFVTTLITPPILNKMLDSDKPVLRKEPAVKKEVTTIHFDMPNPETAQFIQQKVLEAFRNEEFHAHRQQHGTYFLRRNNVFITMRYSRELIEFDCLRNESAFIHTLFYEVIVDLERFMQNLQTLKDKDNIGKKMLETSRENSENKIKCFSKLSPFAIKADLESSTKEDVLRELVDLTVKSGQLDHSQKDRIFDEIMEREKLVSTGMQDGIAIPHVKSESINSLIIAVGLNKNGIDYGSLDNSPSKIFVMILSPKTHPEEYLQNMARISRFLASQDNREKLLSAKNNTELTIILKGHN